MDFYGDAVVVAYEPNNIIDFDIACGICGRTVGEHELTYDADHEGTFAYFECCGGRVMFESGGKGITKFYKMRGF